MAEMDEKVLGVGGREGEKGGSKGGVGGRVRGWGERKG